MAAADNISAIKNDLTPPNLITPATLLYGQRPKHKKLRLAVRARSITPSHWRASIIAFMVTHPNLPWIELKRETPKWSAEPFALNRRDAKQAP